MKNQVRDIATGKTWPISPATCGDVTLFDLEGHRYTIRTDSVITQIVGRSGKVGNRFIQHDDINAALAYYGWEWA